MRVSVVVSMTHPHDPYAILGTCHEDIDMRADGRMRHVSDWTAPQ